MIYRYKTNEGTRCALILSIGRKWMRVGLIEPGLIKAKKVPISEQRYMAPLELSKGEARKANASVRRIMRKKGHTTKLREEITEAIKA